MGCCGHGQDTEKTEDPHPTGPARRSEIRGFAGFVSFGDGRFLFLQKLARTVLPNRIDIWCRMSNSDYAARQVCATVGAPQFPVDPSKLISAVEVRRP